MPRKRLSSKDWDTVCSALYNAAQWEDSLAEAWKSDTPEHNQSRANAVRYRALRNRLFPGHERDGELPDCTAISLHELMAGTREEIQKERGE